MFLMHAGFYVNKCYSGAVWMKTEGVLTARKKIFAHHWVKKAFDSQEKTHSSEKFFVVFHQVCTHLRGMLVHLYLQNL